MSTPEIVQGTVVLSKAGRDKGRYFLVVTTIDEQYVGVADGRLRKIEKPKKKKVKHLRALPVLMPNLLEKLQGGKRIFDAEVRNGLEALGYGSQSPSGSSDEEEA